MTTKQPTSSNLPIAETIPALLRLRAGHSPQKDAIVEHGTRLSYAELDAQSRSRAAWLLAQGVNKGHRVGLLMENGCEWAVNAYAVMRLGATLVPLSTLLRPVELEAQLQLAGLRHLICSEQFKGRDYRTDLSTLDRAQLPSLRHLFWASQLGSSDEPGLIAIADALAERVQPADTMVIIFTSGSSGSPKGVIHSHGGALRANAASLTDRCIDSGDRLYLPMPLFWAGGFTGGLISALNAGATLLTEAEPEPTQTLGLLTREKATLFRGWPDQAAALAAHPAFNDSDLSSLKAGSLEALLPEALRSQQQLRASLFGMTETFGPFCGYPLNEDMPADKKGSCGRPFAGIELRIVDADTGKPLEQGRTGLLQIRGRNILIGICGKEREEIFSADGWYSGGDLARLDSDGFLFYCGRQDDLIKFKGVSVSLTEIADNLEALDGVERALVTTLPGNNTPVIGAAIVPATPSSFELETIQQMAKEQLSAFKVPTRWITLSSITEIPRTAMGKVDADGLRSLLKLN